MILAALLDTYRAAGPSLGIIASEVPPVNWDRSGMEDDLKSWIQSPALLRQRLVPVGERELAMARTKPRDKESVAQSLLEEKVMSELQAALQALQRASEVMQAAR